MYRRARIGSFCRIESQSMPSLRPLRLVLTLLLAVNAHAVTVRLTASDGMRIQVSLHPGDVLRIELPAEPSAGRHVEPSTDKRRRSLQSWARRSASLAAA